MRSLSRLPLLQPKLVGSYPSRIHQLRFNLPHPSSRNVKMAAKGAQDMHEMFNNPEFTKMYAEGAEQFTGWSARILIESAKLDKAADDQQLVVLDLACGTGICSKLLTEILNDKQRANLDLTCADFADSMVQFTAQRIKSFDVKSAQAVKADAMDTKLPSDKFTHIMLNFGPMVFTDGQKGLGELLRVLQPGGTVAMSSWQTVGWLDDVKAAFASDPEVPPFPTMEQFNGIMNQGGNWSSTQWIEEHVAKAGFVDVHTAIVPHTTNLYVEQFTRMMAGMVGLIQKRIWTQEQQDNDKGRANEAVVKYMQDKYGESAITWNWTAISTTAKKPA